LRPIKTVTLSAAIWRLRIPAIAALASLSIIFSAAADSLTNQSWPGIVLHTEVQPQTATNLPLHTFIAEVDLTNPQVHVRVAPGGPDPDGPGKWQTILMQPTRIAARENFALVVNGDFFDARGVHDGEGTNAGYRANMWASTVGPAVTDGVAWSIDSNSRPCLVVHKDRSLTIESVAQPTPDDWEVISGNIMLVENGVIVPHLNILRHPRTLVGLDAKRTKLIIVVVDGRRPGVSMGLTYNEEAAMMVRLGCQTALNLDGGGSSVMAVRDLASGEYHILNTPSDGRERAVANALGISVDLPKVSGNAN
jgi:hypothetical protein